MHEHLGICVTCQCFLRDNLCDTYQPTRTGVNGLILGSPFPTYPHSYAWVEEGELIVLADLLLHNNTCCLVVVHLCLCSLHPMITTVCTVFPSIPK